MNLAQRVLFVSVGVLVITVSPLLAFGVLQ